MKILVTGASGFLGTHLCSKIEENGYSLTKLSSKKCDLTVQGSLEAHLAADEGKFDQIYHLAAWTQAGDFCMYHQGEQWVINQKINTNVLGYWQKSQPQSKLICMGTSCAYDPNMELKEENYMRGEPIDGLFTYAMTKRMLYAGLLALHRQYGLKYMCFVPSTLYGADYHTDGRQMHFIFDLIRKIIRGKRYGEQVVLWGDGYQKREVVYVKDVVGAMLRLSAERENEIVNIGAGEEFTIREFAERICGKVGYDFGKIQFDTSKYVGAKSKCLNIDKLRKVAPWHSQTPLDNGLSATIEWFEKNMKE